MIAKDSFIILQSGTELTGALCRVGLKSRDVSYLHHVTCADLTPQAVASGLRSLLDGLAAAGLKRPDDVRVCLSAGAALFRDWAFPFRSRAKVEQALSLMLETEFPFDADTLSHSVCLTGNAAASAGYKSGVQAISVSLRKEERDSWLDAFEAEGLFPRLVTVDPFPLLMNLPSRQNGMALLLYVERGCSTLALLQRRHPAHSDHTGWLDPRNGRRRPQCFLIRTGKRRSARIRRPAAARNVPRIGRDAFRTGSPSRLWRGLSRKRRVRPFRRSLRAARFRAWSRSPLGRAGGPAGRNRSLPAPRALRGSHAAPGPVASASVPFVPPSSEGRPSFQRTRQAFGMGRLRRACRGRGLPRLRLGGRIRRRTAGRAP